MSDRSVEAEIEENNRRKEARDGNDNGSVVDALDDVLDPITDAIERSAVDDDSDLLEKRREGNDADQRAS